jgi:hypothetical protein
LRDGQVNERWKESFLILRRQPKAHREGGTAQGRSANGDRA